MKADVLLKGGKVVTSGGIYDANIAIKDGVIAGIIRGEIEADKVIDVGGKYVMPGVVEEHVHGLGMDMAKTHGDFSHVSASALVGGVTTVMEMPLTLPATTSLENFKAKQEVAKREFRTDYALYGGGVPGNYEELKKMAEAGAIGFKAMMSGSVPGVFESVNDGELLEIFKVMAEVNGVITVHCENEAMIKANEERLKAEGRKDIYAYFESAPIVQEVEAIERALRLAKEAGCHLHVVHVSCPQGVDLIKKAKAEGQKVTCETGPHYLALSQDDGERLGPYLRYAPPVRTKKEISVLWDQLANGDIDVIACDHGAHPHENKERGWKDIWSAGSGAVGIEGSLSVMLTEGVNKGRMSFEQLVSVMCENPARLFGLYPRKGAIMVGSDADFAVVDLEEEYTIDAQKFQTFIKHSPFDGFDCKGRVKMTILRGEVVMENGQVLAQPGHGQFLTGERK